MLHAVFLYRHLIERIFKMVIAMTGVSGNMGREALIQTLELDFVDTVKILLTPRKRNDKLAKKLKGTYGARVDIVRGWLSDISSCKTLVEGADIVVNMAAVIPPRSDKNASASYECNQLGDMRLADAVAAMPKQAKLIHTSTVAVYGNRTLAHPWGRVGDPLLPAIYDNYAMHKMIAERYVMESAVKNWAVLRQTAMLYDGIIFSNISDGLLFHATLNGPLEWVTARDSGYLIKRIIEREHAGEIDDFWNRAYDISGGAQNRRTGYDTFADGFSIMGGSPKAYFKPNWCATRNFHGMWYADGGELQKLFGYQRGTVADFWADMGKKYRMFKIARIFPSSVIGLFVFRRLLHDDNAPLKWLKRGDEGRVLAAFGGSKAALSLPDKWADYSVADAASYGSREEAPEVKFRDKLLDHGYDERKSMDEWSLEDMNGAAAFRGGKCLSKEYVSPREKLLWQCSEGHTFLAAPYTVLGAGHWCPFCAPEPWNFDRLAKKSPFIAQIWYDSHSEDENISYWFDKDGRACFETSREEEE